MFFFKAQVSITFVEASVNLKLKIIFLYIFICFFDIISPCCRK